MKFRKKPVTIEAIQWNGENVIDVDKFAGNEEKIQHKNGELFIPTLEGVMKANLGDWIIKGVNGEIYPCKPDIFAKTYESLGEVQSVSQEQPKHVYTYFYSFQTDGIVGYGVGTTKNKIVGSEGLKEIAEYILENYPGTNPVILNYKLMNVEVVNE